MKGKKDNDKIKNRSKRRAPVIRLGAFSPVVSIRKRHILALENPLWNRVLSLRSLKGHITIVCGRRRGLVVERRTPEREVGGSILAQVAVLYPWARYIYHTGESSYQELYLYLSIFVYC